MMLLFGTIVTYLYLYMVDVSPLPILVLIIGIGLQSTSFLMFAHKIRTSGNKLPLCYYIFFILVLSMSVAFMKNARFQVWGTDILIEKQVAQNTFTNQYWNSSLIKSSNFVSSLEVTILPSILAELTGLSIDTIFNTIMLGIATSIPVFLFLTVLSITNNRVVAFLSSALFAQNYFFFAQYPNLIKQSFAIVFMLLSLYCYFGTHAVRKKYVLLGILFSFGVIMSHYTISLLFGYVLLFYLLLMFFYRKIQKFSTPTLSFEIVVMYFAMTLCWQIFIMYPVFDIEIGTYVKPVMFALQSLTFGIESPETQYSLNPPSYRDWTVTVWFDLQNILIGFSALLAFITLLRGRMREREDEWTIMGLAALALMIIWVVFPGFSASLYPDRILGFALVFSTYFLASFLLKAMRNGKHMVQIFIAIFLLLALPMNLMLPSHDMDPLYHPIDSFIPERILELRSKGYPSIADEPIALWANKYIRINQPIYLDNYGNYILRLLSPFTCELMTVNSNSSYAYSQSDNFVMLHIYYIKNDLWAYGESFEKDTKASLFLQLPYNIVYDSGENTLVFHMHNLRQKGG